MKSTRVLPFALALALPVAAQQAPQPTSDSLATVAEAPPPARLAEIESARSRRCVPVLARLEALDRDLEPLAVRSERLLALDHAVTLEDSTRIAPLVREDPLERAVAEWFAEDQALGQRYAESGDSAIDARRSEGRQRIRERLRDAFQETRDAAQQKLESAGEYGDAFAECDDAILVRSAVLEACATTSSPVCEAARGDASGGPFRFVDEAADLWGVETIRPWTPPTRLAPAPDGSIGGARTGTRSRRGNLVATVGVEPVFRLRSETSADEAARIETLLDSLGVPFEHPDYLMAPVLVVQLQVAEPLGDETRYFLHFGDLSEPVDQVIWNAPAAGAPARTLLPITQRLFQRLAAGEPMSLTAVRFEDGAPEGQAVYSLEITAVGQATAVGSLLGYMADGSLNQDFMALVPAPPGAGG